MVRVHINISVFTQNAAVGMVSGLLFLSIYPQIGNAISLPVSVVVNTHPQGCFSGHCRVIGRIIAANVDDEVLIELENVIASTSLDAETLMKALEQSYGLVADIWEARSC